MPEEIYSRSPFELAVQYLRCADNPEAEAIWREGLNEEEQSLLGDPSFVRSTIALPLQRVIDISQSEFTQMFAKVFRLFDMLR